MRVRYQLGAQPVDTVLTVQRIAGRWYLEDYIRNAEASLESPDVPKARSMPAGRIEAASP